MGERKIEREMGGRKKERDEVRTRLVLNKLRQHFHSVIPGVPHPSSAPLTRLNIFSNKTLPWG